MLDLALVGAAGGAAQPDESLGTMRSPPPTPPFLRAAGVAAAGDGAAAQPVHTTRSMPNSPIHSTLGSPSSSTGIGDSPSGKEAREQMAARRLAFLLSRLQEHAYPASPPHAISPASPPHAISPASPAQVPDLPSCPLPPLPGRCSCSSASHPRSRARHSSTCRAMRCSGPSG